MFDPLNQKTESEIERTKALNADIYNNLDFVKSVCNVVKSIDTFTGELKYLDYVEMPGTQEWPKDAATFDKSFEVNKNTRVKEMGLKLMQKVFVLDNNTINVPITREQAGDTSAADILLMVLSNEVKQGIEIQVLNKISEYGQLHYQNSLGFWDKFFLFFNKKYKKTGKLIKGVSADRLIIAKILMLSNQVAVRCRRGPANFAVLNGRIGSILQDSSTFKFANQTETLDSAPTVGAYLIGSIAGLNIFIDPKMKWDDLRIIVGRKGTEDSPGLNFYYAPNGTRVAVISEATMAPKGMIGYNSKIVEVGFHPEDNYNMGYIKLDNHL